MFHWNLPATIRLVKSIGLLPLFTRLLCGPTWLDNSHPLSTRNLPAQLRPDLLHPNISGELYFDGGFLTTSPMFSGILSGSEQHSCLLAGRPRQFRIVRGFPSPNSLSTRDLPDDIRDGILLQHKPSIPCLRRWIHIPGTLRTRDILVSTRAGHLQRRISGVLRF